MDISQWSSQGVSEPVCVAVQPEGGQSRAREDGAPPTGALPPAQGHRAAECACLSHVCHVPGDHL